MIPDRSLHGSKSESALMIRAGIWLEHHKRTERGDVADDTLISWPMSHCIGEGKAWRQGGGNRSRS